MDVLSVSPFRTGSVLWRPRPDRWTLTVICKGTYALAPGESGLAVEQEDVNDRDNFWDDDPRRSVHAPGDLAPFKPRADVMLVGHAFAPRSEVARSLVTRLIVGELQKAIEVFCPRVWTREGELREGARWSKMPLRYEYAAGGRDTWNPVGISHAAVPDAYGQRLMPHLQPPGLRVAHWNDLFAPAGFGPIASTWLLRREKLGARAEGWSDEGWTGIPLDDDFDGEFFQAAPPDQQLETLHDDESIVLEYLHPDHPSLATKLPGLHPHAFVDIPGLPVRDLVMTADTLWIDTDRGLCTVTWRGQVAVDGPEQAGRVVIAIEEAGQRLVWPTVSTLATMKPGGTMPAEAMRGRPPLATLPFRLSETEVPPVPTAPGLGAGEDPDDAPHTPRAGPRRTLQMVSAGEEAIVLPPWLSHEAKVDAGDLVESPTTLSGLRPEPARTPPVVVSSTPPLSAPSAPSAPVPSVRIPKPAETALEILWHAPALAGRLRRNALWAQILAPGKAPRTTMTMVSASLPDAAEAAEDALETEVSAILARGAPSGVELESALFESTAVGGALALPLVLLAGELELRFDEVAALQALLVAARPLARSDARLQEAVAFAAEMATTPLQSAPDVAESLAASVRRAWEDANKALPPEHLEAQTARALLAARAYQRRDLLGEAPGCVRALLTLTGAHAPVPAYLPEEAARRLPLFARFPVKMIAEVLPQQDQSEEAPVALRVLALARVITRSRRTTA
jgi:hypothetical protein